MARLKDYAAFRSLTVLDLASMNCVRQVLDLDSSKNLRMGFMGARRSHFLVICAVSTAFKRNSFSIFKS